MINFVSFEKIKDSMVIEVQERTGINVEGILTA